MKKDGIEAQAFSTQGIRNAQNGDAFVADLDAGVFGVCDGVSGQNSPSLASTTAVKVMAETARRDAGANASVGELCSVMDKAFTEANQQILKVGGEAGQSQRPATTATAVLIRGSWAAVAHVGDSRAYLIRDGAVKVLTEDHSHGADMVRRKLWTAEQAKKSPNANALTRALGVQQSLRTDLLQVELSPGDILLMTSDGIHDAMGDAALNDFILQAGDGLDPEKLVEAALAAKGRDDATAVVVKYSGSAVKEEVTAKQKIDVLSKVRLFQYLSFPELNKVMNLAKKLEVPKGSVVIQEGAQGTDMYVVLAGSLEVVKGGSILKTRGPGEMVGEMAVIDGSPRFASVRAADRCVLLRIMRDPLFTLMQQEPSLAVKLLWAICGIQNERLKETTDQALKK